MGQPDRHGEPGGPLGQGRNRGAAAFADYEIVLPVPWRLAVVGLGGPLGDQRHVFERASVTAAARVPVNTAVRKHPQRSRRNARRDPTNSD